MNEHTYRRLIALHRQDNDEIDFGAEFDTLVSDGLKSSHQRSIFLAAELTQRTETRRFLPELLDAYARLLKKPVKIDPGCEAKTAIVQTLLKAGFDDEDFFLKAIKYRQLEPAYGGSVDTAAKLRVLAGFALTDINRIRAVEPLVELLLDPEKTARAGAARALATCGETVAKHLLRLKLEFGDSEAEVVGEVCSAYLAVTGVAGLPIASQHLKSESMDHRMETMLAIGESRLIEALEPLRRRMVSIDDREEARIALTAMALIQHEDATEYLLESLKPESGNIFRREAISALGHVRDRVRIKAKVRSILEKTDDRGLERVFHETFEG